MQLQVFHEFAVAGADKEQAVTLALEYWTGQGFTVHNSSYNRMTFRQCGYGTLSGTLKAALVGSSWRNTPIEITAICQVFPNETKWKFHFKAGLGCVERHSGDFGSLAQAWCRDFQQYCDQWMKD